MYRGVSTVSEPRIKTELTLRDRMQKDYEEKLPVYVKEHPRQWAFYEGGIEDVKFFNNRDEFKEMMAFDRRVGATFFARKIPLRLPGSRKARLG